MHIRLARFFAGAKSVIVSCDSPFTIKADQGDVLFAGRADEICKVSLSSDCGVLCAPVSAASDSESSQAGDGDAPADSNRGPVETASPVSSNGILRIALAGGNCKWERYRGQLSFGVAGGDLRITNDIPIESYLCGVLKPEIGAGAPTEALKAQAVAARTYAVRNIGRLASEGADLDDTTRTQSYLGVGGETPAICQAVQATAGLIMTYQGEPIDAVYSTDCGGETAPGGVAEPYLKPVSDPDCAEKPPWTKVYSKEELQAALARSAATSVTELESLTVQTTDSSGRAADVEITGAKGAVKGVSGAQLREVLGTDNLRSTLFTVKMGNDGNVTFTGHGWGHGMGMCQDGAIALAQGAEHESCDQILKHYYTGIEIVPLTPALVASVRMPSRQADLSPKPASSRVTLHPVSSSAFASGGKS